MNLLGGGGVVGLGGFGIFFLYDFMVKEKLMVMFFC